MTADPGKCASKLRMSETVVESYVAATGIYTNALGVLHGGHMLRWIVDYGLVAASRVVKGYALLAGIDFVDLSSPVREGETLMFKAWVSYAGRSSVEVMVRAESLGIPGLSSPPRRAAVAHMTMVSVDDSLRPRPHGACIEAASREEESLMEVSLKLRRERSRRIEARRSEPFNTEPPRPVEDGFTYKSSRIVNPVDSVAYNVMHAGSMLYFIDELSAVLAAKYASNIVVTGFLGPADFYRPVPVGYVLDATAAVSYAGRSSVEVEVKVLARPMPADWSETAAKAYLTLVSLAPDGSPTPLPRGRAMKQTPDSSARAEWRRGILRLIEEGALDLKPPS